MLLLYRLGAYIPAPGINVDVVEDLADNFSGQSNVLGFLNLFSGGSLQRFAIFALGIMPYITASIMLQLLTVVIPQLDKLRKEGEVGQQKITQYTRYLTVALAFGQSIGYVFLFRTFAGSEGTEVVDNFSFGRVFVIVMTLTAGCGSTYLPLRVNMAGVIPVIFAASLMAFPPTVGELTQASWAQDFSAFFSPNGAAYLVGESIFIIVFTYFYTAVTFNPVEQ